MAVWFGLGGGPTTVNIIPVTALHHIINPSFFYLDMFAVWISHKNYECIGQYLDYMMTFIPMRLYKSPDLS